MTNEECILEFLRKSPGATSVDIARGLGILGTRMVNVYLTRLQREGAITREEGFKRDKYLYPHRVYHYFVEEGT